MPDFVKRNDQELKAQAQLVSTVVGLAPTAYGQTALTMTEFGNLLGQFSTTLEDHVAAQEAARAKTQAKEDDRALLVAALRDLNRVAQAHAGITDEQLAVAGLPVHDPVRTPGAAPTQRPECQVEVVGQEHRVTVINPDNLRAAKPAEARFIELYRAVVAPGQPLPSSVDGMTLVGVYTNSRITLTYAGDDIGKTVVYIARYVGAKSQPGPAGTTAAASIAA